MSAENLVGVWDLVSCIGVAEDGATFSPYGDGPTGKLIYAANGHMSVILMAEGRPRFASDDISQATVEEVSHAFSSFDAYSGRWTYLDELKAVEHVIEAGRIPNWVGAAHRRLCRFEDNLLVLETEPFKLAGQLWTVRVTWRRLD